MLQFTYPPCVPFFAVETVEKKSSQALYKPEKVWYNEGRKLCERKRRTMTLCDYHTHTSFSFDGAPDSTPDSLCRRALEIGLTDLCITDHCDVNGEAEGIYDPYQADAAWEAMTAAQEKYRGRLYLTRGIELGNASQYPEVARAVLARHPYEFVIGSLHNLRGVPDFAMLKFEEMTPALVAQLFDRALDETAEMTRFPGLSTLGHLTYIHRYITLAGQAFDFKPYYEKIQAIFRLLMERDMALELNVSTLWRGLGIGMPTLELLKLYADCGGRLVTIGSDAHCPANLGRAIRKGYALLAAAGLPHVTVIREGQRVELPVE